MHSWQALESIPELTLKSWAWRHTLVIPSWGAEAESLEFAGWPAQTAWQDAGGKETGTQKEADGAGQRLGCPPAHTCKHACTENGDS